jgi:PAS domain S-box-containing protein
MSVGLEPHSGTDDDLRRIYRKEPWRLNARISRYLTHLQALVDADSRLLTYENPDFREIRNHETISRIRDGLDAVVDVYEARSDAKTHRLNILSTWAFGSTLTLLLLLGFFVFRPMAHRVRREVRALDHLNANLETRVVERTFELRQRAEQLAASEAALRESESLYSSLVDTMPMSVMRKDCGGRFTFANDRFCELVDRPLQELMGCTDLDLYPPELAKKYRDDDVSVMQNGSVFQDIEQHQTQDGRDLFVEVLKVPLKNADGQIIGTQVMFWDVTDRTFAERRALRAERLAAIGEMVTGVAHESRNALQQIQACSQMLKWQIDTDPQKLELISDLQRAEERLLRLFEELRTYAAPIKLDQQPCEIPDVIARAWVATATERQNRNAALTEHGRLHGSTCRADGFQLEQVFRNLFENALAACLDPVKITVTYERIEEEGRCDLQILVRDNGPGLSPEQKRRIFEPFFTTKTRGSGLGMAIVKRIVEAHSGRIEVVEDSRNGAGFVVRLPLEKRAEDAGLLSAGIKT